MLFAKVADFQVTFDGSVRNVQVIPSVEEAALVESAATVTKVLFPKVTEYQGALDGSVRAVQVIPSVDEAAVVELYADATATKVLLP